MTSTWKTIGASVQGVSHVRTNTPCQDAWHAQVVPNGCVLALADGAGTAAFSRRGAKLAVRAACGKLVQCLQSGHCGDWHSALGFAFQNAYRRLERHAMLHNIPLQSLACTLTCVVCADNGIAVAQIGDGTVVIQWDDTDALETLMLPHRGAYANETRFLTHLADVPAEQIVRCVVVKRQVRGMILMTDGMMRLALHFKDGFRPHAPFFLPFLSLAAQTDIDNARANTIIGDFLRSPQVCERTSDDKTIVTAFRLTDSA